MLNRLSIVTGSMNLGVDVGKTKVMVFDKRRANINCGLKLIGQLMNEVNEFVYLRKMFTQMMELLVRKLKEV